MKNKIIYTIFLFTAVSVGLISCRKEKVQPEQANGFIKYYGKGGTQTAGNVAVTPDGGYVLVGTTDSYGNGKDILVVKTDKYGNEEWSKVLGGTGDDEGKWVIVTPDNGYVISGSKAENASTLNTDVWILKLNSTGQEVWSKIYGVPGKNESAARVINTPTDGGYISVGTTTNSTSRSSVYLLKMNSVGDTLWSGKYANGTSNDLFNYGTSIQQIDDLNYITSAYTTDAGGTLSSLDMMITTGRLQNGTSYGSRSSIDKSTHQLVDIKNARDIILVSSGDKYILGTTLSEEIYILQTTKDENFVAFKSYDIPGLEEVFSFTKTSDNGFVIAGSSINNGNKDILIIRTDANLSPIWTKNFGGTGNDIGTSVIELSDGSFVISGTIAFGGSATGANNVMSLIHINSNGELK